MNTHLPLERADSYFNTEWRGSRSPFAGKQALPFITISRESGSGGSSLAHLLQRLDPKRFVRVHRSVAVNTARIRELQPRSHGDYTVILKNGTELVMSRGFRPQFEHWLRQPL